MSCRKLHPRPSTRRPLLSKVTLRRHTNAVCINVVNKPSWSSNSIERGQKVIALPKAAWVDLGYRSRMWMFLIPKRANEYAEINDRAAREVCTCQEADGTAADNQNICFWNCHNGNSIVASCVCFFFSLSLFSFVFRRCDRGFVSLCLSRSFIPSESEVVVGR